MLSAAIFRIAADLLCRMSWTSVSSASWLCALATDRKDSSTFIGRPMGLPELPGAHRPVTLSRRIGCTGVGFTTPMREPTESLPVAGWS